MHERMLATLRLPEKGFRLLKRLQLRVRRLPKSAQQSALPLRHRPRSR